MKSSIPIADAAKEVELKKPDKRQYSVASDNTGMKKSFNILSSSESYLSFKFKSSKDI